MTKTTRPTCLRSKNVDRFNHDEDAHNYDHDVTNEQDPIRTGYKELLEWAARNTKSTLDTRVLELGSGTGNLSILLPPCRHLTCVDISLSMTDIAKRKLTSGDHRALNFVQDDVLAFCRTAPSGAFHRILSTYTLHHLDETEKQSFFEEVVRILDSKDGRLVVGDLMFENAAQRTRLLQSYRQQELESLAEEIEDEFFWDLEVATQALESLAFSVETHRFSELSWGLVAQR